MRCFLIGIAGFLFAGLVAAIAIPSYGDFRSRASLSETMSAVVPLRTKIAEALVKDPKSVAAVAGSATREPPAGANYLKVAADGTIVFRSAKHGQLMLFEPEVRQGTVTWKCVGSPPRDVPPDCR